MGRGGHAGTSLVKDYEGDGGFGLPVVQREAAGAGSLHPGEGMAQGNLFNMY